MKMKGMCGNAVAWGAVLLLLASVPLGAQSAKSLLITAVGRHEGTKAAPLAAAELQLKVGGKVASVTEIKPATERPLEVVILLDTTHGNRESMQFDDVRHFIESLGAQDKSAVAYMQNGQAVLATPLTSDVKTAESGLKLASGPSASPYFCLSDLAKHWPSKDAHARRVVVMVTSGFEPYEGEVYNPSNVYVQAAINDALNAHIEVEGIFWIPAMQVQVQATPFIFGGQSYMLQLTDATGGMSYGFGNGAPISFKPYLEDLQRRLAGQHEVSFVLPAGVHAKGLQAVSLKSSNKADVVSSPKWVVLEDRP